MLAEPLLCLLHPFGPQVRVYNSKWENILTFPQPDQLGTDMVTDALIADINSDGELELAVGYSGSTGLQVLKLQGERLWANRKDVQFVLRLAASNPNADKKRSLLCTTSQGTVLSFDSEGKAAAPWRIPNESMIAIFGPSTGSAPWLAYLLSPQGKNVAIGLSQEGQVRWTHQLPEGTPQRPVESFITTPITNPGVNDWLLVGPDGSMHLLDAEEAHRSIRHRERSLRSCSPEPE